MKRLDPYTKLFEDRIIFLGVQVDDASANDVIAQLIVLESQDPDRDILMYINSPGGSFTAMTAIYDTMQYVRPDIQTFVIGQAASAAAVLLGAGARASGSPCRTPDPHPPAARSRAPAAGLRHRDPGQRDPADARLARGDAWRSHSGRDVEQVRKDIERDKILSAADGQGVRPDRRGPAVPQELAVELTTGSTARR